MHLPVDDDLPTARLSKEPTHNCSLIQHHTGDLADRLEEAYRVVRENDKVGRQKQKKHYH
jgi:hypothetical protein